MAANVLAIWSLAPLLVGAVLGLLLDAFSSRRAALVAVLAGFGVTAGAAIAALVRSAEVATAWSVLHVGGVFATIAAVVGVLGALAVLGGWSSLEERESGGSLAGLMTFGAAASIVVASSRDLTLLLIGIETAAACAYALVSAGGGRRSRESAMKYFIQGAIASGVFVFGMAILVTVFVPSGDITLIAGAIGATRLPLSVASAAVVLLVAALAFKAGAAPFHSWAPDAYENAPAESAAYLASGPKLGVIAALALFVAFVASGSDAKLQLGLTAAVALLAVASVLVGSVGALRQRSYTRMLGYAGIAQVGYALIGIATTQGPTVPIFFTACYALAATGTFLSAAAFRRADPAWDGSVDGLAGMSAKAPWTSAATAVLVISLAGIPPLLGFWAKLLIFIGAIGAASAAFETGAATVAWICVCAAGVGILGSVISLGYYGSVLRSLYQPAQAASHAEDPVDESPNGTESPERGTGSAGVAVVLIAALTVLAGVIPLVVGIPVIWRYFG